MISEFRTVQNLLWPPDAIAGVEELYVNRLSGEFFVDDHLLNIGNDSEISFDTFYNSFYEAYWTEYTPIQDLLLEIEFKGVFELEVWRENVLGRVKLVRIRCSADDFSCMTIPLEVLQIEKFERGRQFITIKSLQESSINYIRYVTSTQPMRRVGLSIGICTFNREKYVARNITAVLQALDENPGFERVFVVNQGNRFESLGMMQLIARSSKIVLIEQSNLGGCGGFTRSLYETLKFDGITHHLLMDDDALIDARILITLINFLSFCQADVCVGGQMLDLYQRQRLHEAGAYLSGSTEVKSLMTDTNLRSPGALGEFGRVRSVDFNAWWFCAIPIHFIKELGFPAPIFIRGDDIEYGIRLQTSGARNIQLPGIAVWHEPFYVKNGTWQTYYDIRNRLILAATYPDRFNLMPATIELLWWMLEAAALHNYVTTAMIAEAINDFCAGPQSLRVGADTKHSHIMSINRAEAPHAVEHFDRLQELTSDRPMPRSDVLTAALLTRRLVSLLVRGGTADPVMLMDYRAKISNISRQPYVKTNYFRSFHALYKPDRMRLWSAIKLSISAWLNYVRNSKRASKMWKEDISSFRSEDFWTPIFKSADRPQ